MEIYKIKIYDSLSKTEIEGEFQLNELTYQTCQLHLIFRNKDITEENLYFSHALDTIISKLKKMGYYLICNGASPDVVKSGMLTDMSNGRMGYISSKKDLPFSKEDLSMVNLFEPAEDLKKVIPNIPPSHFRKIIFKVNRLFYSIYL